MTRMINPIDTINWQKANKNIGRSGYWKRSVSIKNVSTVNADSIKQVPDLKIIQDTHHRSYLEDILLITIIIEVIWVVIWMID